MISDNFSIFTTNCASPEEHAGLYCENSCECCAGEMASKIPEVFYAFGPQLNAFVSVGILLKIFVVSCSSSSENIAEFRYALLYIAHQVEFRCFFYKNFTLLHSKFHIWRRLTAFFITRGKKKPSRIYLDKAAFQDFKVFPAPLTTRLRGFSQGLRDRKIVKKIFSLRPNKWK